MKTLHHHAHLAPHEIEDIKQAIQFCRDNTQRRVSVLGIAQEHYPLAYQEYIDKANKNLGLFGWTGRHKKQDQLLWFEITEKSLCENSK